jgi:hypothetical protein
MPIFNDLPTASPSIFTGQSNKIQQLSAQFNPIMMEIERGTSHFYETVNQLLFPHGAEQSMSM